MQDHVLGDYKILKSIGEGTLGAVVLAEHRFIKKQYVLKILPKELSQDRNFITRFEEQVAKLALLDHPHIVRIHNISFAEGSYFLVSDCVVDSIGETTNLAQYMSGRKERLKEEELIHVLSQIADALDYAHTKGQVAHQALKLNNVLIGKGNPGMEVFLSDLGLAKIISPGKIISRNFLATAEALGALPVEKENDQAYSPYPVESDKLDKLSLSFLQSYAFLAPEQKRFESVGMQVDSFAFGVLVYYLISGVFPEGKFQLPSEIAPEYALDWDTLVSDCLAHDPTRRPSQLKKLFEQTRPVQPVFTPRPQPEASREEPGGVESVKAAVVEQSPQPAPVPVMAYSKPTAAPALERRVVVETKDITEATPPAITPPQDKHYSEKLSSMLHRDPVVTEYQPEVQEARNIAPIETEMVVVRGGDFFRGSNQGNRDEMPRHLITLDSFAMDVHPVTNEQFVRFLDFMGGEKDPNYNDLIRLKDSRITRSSGRTSIESGYAKHPVVGVTWYGAVAYAKWVGKRLPSEAEWEIAARGRLDESLFPTGESIEKSQANFFSSDTTTVMSYAPNGYGLYDMVGNVYEWCQDWYGYNYYETSAQEPVNPRGPIQGVYRVLRGGCWKSLKEDMRSSHRHRNNPGTVNSTYGFRCATDAR